MKNGGKNKSVAFIILVSVFQLSFLNVAANDFGSHSVIKIII